MLGLLSLKLLLLAFFILLTTLAQFEQERVEQVVRSVNEAFDGRSLRGVPLSGHSSGIVVDPGEERLINRLEHLFRTTLPVRRVDVTEGGRRMLVTLEQSRVFVPAGTRLQPAFQALVQRVAATLERHAAGAARIDLRYGYPVSAGADLAASEGRDPVFRRVVAMAAAFERQGMAPDRLSVALEPGPENLVRLLFHLPDADADAGSTPAPAGGQR